MVSKQFTILIMALVLAGAEAALAADDTSTAARQRGRRSNFLDDLDGLGRDLFGSSNDDEVRRPASPVAVRRSPSDAQTEAPRGMNEPRASRSSGERRASVYPPRSTDRFDSRDLMPEESPLPAPTRNRSRSPAAEAVAAPSEEAPSPSGSVLDRPLHERMSAFRGSAFGGSLGRSGDLRPPTPVVAPPRQEVVTAPPPAANVSAPAREPTPAVRPAPAAVRPAPVEVAQPAIEPAPHSRIVRSLAPSPVRAEARAIDEPVAKSPTVVNRDNLLIARRGPVLSVETIGSRRITVGKESVYQLNLANTGEVAADEVVVHVNLPAWADVLNAETSMGAAQLSPGDATTRPLAWKVGQLPAGSREKLVLRLVPRESRAFDLAVRWDYQPVASQATIEVQEPKLAVRLEGPRDVLYGRKELYSLHVSNTGDGEAENVAISLLPIGTGENQPAVYRMGVLGAGQERTIEVELTARQTGELMIQVEARGDNGVRADLAEKVLVRRADLQVDVLGPQMQYVNTVAAYRVRVMNPGNAAAKNLRITAALPAGAKYVAGVDNAKISDDGTRIQWGIDVLQPAGEQVFLLRCSLSAPGENRVEVSSTADDELMANAGAMTQVDAMADLRLDVKDPQGPVALGEDALYEVHVRNRGTKAAESVEVLVFFSSGIEPASVEGGAHKIQPGQVVFEPIASLAPNSEAVMKIRAKAETAGAHVFRTEVHCKPLGTRLLAEETTHFYQSGPYPSRPQIAIDPPRPSEPERTAERFSPPISTPGGLMPSPMKR